MHAVHLVWRDVNGLWLDCGIQELMGMVMTFSIGDICDRWLSKGMNTRYTEYNNKKQLTSH
jgi:hypothetical protein